MPIKDDMGVDECNDWNVASEFFHMTFHQRKLYHLFVMISSLGNIIVTTFTSARGKMFETWNIPFLCGFQSFHSDKLLVKKEIAKTAILPFSNWFLGDYDMVRVVKS